MNIHRNISILLWLLPTVACLHVFEEFAFPGSLKGWIASYKPKRLKSNFYYFVANASIILGAFIIAIKAEDILGYRIYLFIIDVLGWNAFTHIRGTLQKKQYCPGIISGSLLCLPLMVLSNTYFVKTNSVDIYSALLFICIGLIIGFYIGSLDLRKKDAAGC